MDERTEVNLDGSQGEGGGQALRTALTLSLLTGRSFTIERLRAGRKTPGLMHQHLACAEAAAKVCGGSLDGAAIGSQRLRFRPGPVKPGEYRFDLVTAEPTSLLLQTLLVPLALAGGSSRVVLTGGTHVPRSPSFHFLTHPYLHALTQMGFQAELHLGLAGYFPGGGGIVTAEISPAERSALRPLQLLARTSPYAMWTLAVATQRPEHIAEVATGAVVAALRELRVKTLAQIDNPNGPAPGAAIHVFGGPPGRTEVGFWAPEEKGKSAETLAQQVLDPVRSFLATGAALDECTADQVLVPCLCGRKMSCFTVSRLSEHLITCASVAKAFLPSCHIDIQGRPGGKGMVALSAG